ncbi:hypothetical protein ICM05_11665 [Leucobacter sp. cx-42]|uniref:hypothetical protein n=1 Tax=unclassified Leucobacter TaxID=2621730 RepID=UPI00165E070B|nr:MULTISPECIES: hypothetical protein [unclassified Leucobacter]MBC9955281.1 hypothetical protein [Leucobacter sp. cx-42]
MFASKFAAVGAAALVLTGLVGCASSGASASTVAGSVEAPVESYEVSRIMTYDTIADLAAGSDLIVVADISEEFTETELDGLPFTDRVVHPSEVLKGSATDQVTVMSVGTQHAEGALQPGKKDLLFLTEYEFEPGVATGKYAVTGVYAGVYEQTRGSEFIKLDPESPELPDVVLLEDVIAAIADN